MFQEIYVKNNVFKTHDSVEYNKDIISEMENSPLIRVKELPNGLKSYNFTREVFYDDKFDSLNIKARGLFMYEDGQVACRAYDKFFNIFFEKSNDSESDYQDTTVDNIKDKLTFPVSVYKKENGFLGMLSWNKVSNDWLIATKSSTEGDFANWFGEILKRTGWLKEEVKQYIIDNNVTLIFECIDQLRDPHIIEYEDLQHVVLLDIVKNDLSGNFNAPNDNLCLAMQWGFSDTDCKELIAVFNDWEHLRAFLKLNDTKELSSWNKMIDDKNYIFEDYYNVQVEGFVLKDSKGYMTKFKTGFYRFWKSLRPALQSLQAGKQPNTRNMNKEQLEVYNWLKEQPLEVIKDWSVIGMRRNYLKNKK